MHIFLVLKINFFAYFSLVNINKINVLIASNGAKTSKKVLSFIARLLLRKYFFKNPIEHFIH